MCCFDSVMNEDLEPFEKLGGITKDQFDRSRHRGTHYQIISHKLYREDQCMFPFRRVINWILILFSIFSACKFVSIFKTMAHSKEIHTVSDVKDYHLVYTESVHISIIAAKVLMPYVTGLENSTVTSQGKCCY